MNKNFCILLLIIFTTICKSSFSQIRVGEWRSHFDFKKTHRVINAPDKIYVAGELAVFSFDKNDGSIENLSKVEGFSDCGIQTIAYNHSNNTLIIAYQNSNIDVLKNDIIYNFSEIKRKQISADKTIYNISFIGNTAYLSCGFGIVLFDTDNLEFDDTYIIGDNASYIKVNDLDYDLNYIYAATDIGLLQADRSSFNLSDYREWNLHPTIPNNDYIFNEVETFNGMLFANQINSVTGRDTLLYFGGSTWNYFQNGTDNISSLNTVGNNLVIGQKQVVRRYNQNLTELESINWYNFYDKGISTWPAVNYAVIDDRGKFLIADERFGLVYFDSYNAINFIYPQGTYNNSTAHVKTIDKTVITTNGNNNATAWHEPVYNSFTEETWENYGITQDTARNLFSIAIDPINHDHLFIGSWGYGVFEYINNQWLHAYNHTNSSLQPIQGYGYGYIRISSLAFDQNNNLWIANQAVGEPISVRTKDNNWLAYNFGGAITNYPVTEILVTENNNKWVLLGDNKGLLVFDDNSTPLEKQDDTYKKFYPTSSEGEIISKTISAIDEDLDGNIWIGTDEGICIYYDTEDVFSDNYYADRIQLTSYGNDTTEQYLLSTDIITDIETDGANRKWISTQNSGLFLVSENGKEEIHNFNIYNSPLISNTINDIGINHVSGEVFILTDKGVMSYRGEATLASDEFGDVYVFPNPVRPGYDGKITITGLANNVNVKITDISGNVVYDTNALGGQAIWDGKTHSGRKVSTGVYLVFCSNEDGTQTYVTKLLFVN